MVQTKILLAILNIFFLVEKSTQGTQVQLQDFLGIYWHNATIYIM